MPSSRPDKFDKDNAAERFAAWEAKYVRDTRFTDQCEAAMDKLVEDWEAGKISGQALMDEGREHYASLVKPLKHLEDIEEFVSEKYKSFENEPEIQTRIEEFTQACGVLWRDIRELRRKIQNALAMLALHPGVR